MATPVEEYTRLSGEVDVVNQEVARLDGIRQTHLQEVANLLKKYGAKNVSELTVMTEAETAKLNAINEAMKEYVTKMAAEVAKAKKVLEPA